MKLQPKGNMPKAPPARKTLRGYRQTCRVRVRIEEQEHDVWLLMANQRADGRNEPPIEDDVYLHPLGWFKTDNIEFVELLDWKEN